MPVTDSQRLLMLVALQLGLFGLGWAVAILYMHESRAAFIDMVGFSITTAAGVGLLALRDEVQGPGERAMANVCVIAGLVMLWRGIAAMWRLRLPPWLLYVLPALGTLATLWSGFVTPDFGNRVSAFFLTCAWIVSLAPASGFNVVRHEFGPLPAWLLVACGGSVGAVMVARTVEAWWAGQVRELDLSLPGNFVPVIVLLMAVSLANFALGFGMIARMVKRLDRLSRYDSLTGLLNRRALIEALEAEWQRRSRYGGPYAVLALDIDHFKRVNDGHGHAMGDLVLKRLAAVFGTVLRRTDIAGRTGGEEFVVILMNIEPAPARAMAERLRLAVAQADWPQALAEQGGVTVSLGLAQGHANDASASALLERADQALYRAKHAGRNRVIESDAPAKFVASPQAP